MSDKKGGLGAFLKKQGRGKKPGANKDTETQAEEAKTVTEEAKVQDAKNVETKNQEPVAAKTGTNNESSDDEDDDKGLNYGAIKEAKANTNANQQKDLSLFQRNTEKKADGAVSQKKATGDITFGGGKPKFGRGKGKLAGFGAGLDDEDGGDDKGRDGPAEEESGPGGRQFVNLSSSAKTGFREEEEKREARPAAVKPTFRGKANLTGTGGPKLNNEDDTGPKPSYDFSVAFRGQGGDERRDRREEGKTEDRQDTANRGGGRGRRGGRGGRGGFKTNAQEEDEGFEIVRNGRPKPQKKRSDSLSDSDEEPSGGRGGRGRGRGDRGGFQRPGAGERGGFTNSAFTNSGKNRVQE